MKRMGILFERMTDFAHLRASTISAAKGKRLSAGSAAFLAELESRTLDLQQNLRSFQYRPGPYLRFVVNDRKTRIISAAPFEDRVVHHAVCSILERRFEDFAIYDSYACRKGKGTIAAIQKAQEFSRSNSWFLKLDIRKFFETADHRTLKDIIVRLVKDKDMLWLLGEIIDSGSYSTGNKQGIPIGNLTSQHFANVYLSVSDHYIKEILGVRCYIRYMDDMLLFSDSNCALKGWRNHLAEFFPRRLKVELKEEVTLLDRTSQGMPFLGFRVWPHWIRLDPCGLRRLRRKVRNLHRQLRSSDANATRILHRLQSLIAWADLGSGPSAMKAALGPHFVVDIESCDYNL